MTTGGGGHLTDLAEVLRAAGLTVVEVHGWERRARSGGLPYGPGRPTHVMWHHTVSNTAPKNDANYICFGAQYPPIANLLFPRDGSVWVCAGGPSNTNGSGEDSWGGGVPDNAMNAYAIGCEISNEGTGEPYPAAQQNTVLAAGVAMSKRYVIPAGHHRAHFEWSPGRKIDPFGPSRWNDNQRINWMMDKLRSDVQAVLTVAPPPVTTDQENDMVRIDLNPNTPRWVSMVIGATTITHTVDGYHAAVLEKAKVSQVVVNERDMEGILRSLRATNNSPFAPGMKSANATLHSLWEKAKLSPG